MGSQMILKVVRHHSVPVGGRCVTLPTSIYFARSLQVDMLEGLSWDCQFGTVAMDWRSLGQTCRECGVPQGPAMASLGPICMGNACGTSFSSLGDAGAIVLGEWWALFENKFAPVTCHLLERAPEFLREREWSCQPCGSPLQWGLPADI